MRANLRDVAERAGVSVRTVSNVVNTPEVVAPATRERVQRVIDEVGYRPNIAARQLRRGRGDVIGLVVPEIDSPYFAELAAHVVRAAEERGWTVLVEQTDGDPRRERDLLDGARGQGVDGVVFSPWSMTPAEVSRRSSAPPVVMLGEQAGFGHVDRVAIDNQAAAREATAHLVASGRRRVAAVGLQPHLSNETARHRLAGYRAALAAGGLPEDPALEVGVERLHHADGVRAMAALLDLADPPDAVFCFTDQLALGALRACASREVAVPGDLDVVGFDDIEAGRYSVPSLTTVAPDKQRLAALALQTLAERMADPSLPGRDVVVPHELLVRESAPGR
ncbi:MULTISPECIES: LacI family DNA-binding transcriptional regulator [unclassified Nocardioides]|uniref:LacI family DNA-binding transcriptional regulator n=1 Tax=unclassified Nocardioides TaxID=2615069 RepID=UPI002667117D|nr:LacI family DNA-binding transcriptional regulator [Nocardioides sp. Arc9.136]WKN46736.1 LacI family DNA-binding transcriptional regulator [Nocardioides sp. Arc9.136]